MTYKEFKKALNRVMSMSDGTPKQRVERLRAMDNFVLEYFDDEYNIYTWQAEGMPDAADDESFVFVANDMEDYKDVKSLFMRLANKELEDYKR